MIKEKGESKITWKSIIEACEVLGLSLIFLFTGACCKKAVRTQPVFNIVAAAARKPCEQQAVKLLQSFPNSSTTSDVTSSLINGSCNDDGPHKAKRVIRQ